LYFKSRSKDIIIRGGTNIYPAEVEAFIRTNPKIIDACVFGIPDERLGEEVAVWIRIKPNTNFTLDELKLFCEGQIAKFKIPKYMKIVDAFPFNPNGKVMRNIIIEKAKDEFKA
jgi:fatty-acyl-CoA synthase